MQFDHFLAWALSYQIWPCHVTQAKNLSFPYIKSYCPLNFRKSHQISWFCCIPNGSYKEDNLKEGRIPPPPPPCGIGLTELDFWNTTYNICWTLWFILLHVVGSLHCQTHRTLCPDICSKLWEQKKYIVSQYLSMQHF